MPLPPNLRQAAEQVAKDAPIPQDQRVALKKYLSAAHEELRYSADELFIRALLKCCACLVNYKARDRYYLKVWLSKVIGKIENEKI
jgi:hypothetical protein